MTKHYIITTTNYNPTYYTFLPTAYNMWKKYFPNSVFVLGFVGTLPENDKFVTTLKKYCDEFHYFKTIEGVTEGCQAKTTRMWLASTYEDNVCTVVDIDLYILKPEWLKNNIKPAFTDKKFVSIGSNVYIGTEAEGKFPMYYTTAISNIWKKIINYQNYNYQEWFNHISNLPNPVDIYENPKNPFNKFSDESLLRYFVVRHPDQEWMNKVHLKVNRKNYKLGLKPPDRIDRSWWPRNCNTSNMDYVKQHNYIDCFPVRPYNQNINRLMPVLRYIGLSDDISNIKL